MSRLWLQTIYNFLVKYYFQKIISETFNQSLQRISNQYLRFKRPMHLKALSYDGK